MIKINYNEIKNNLKQKGFTILKSEYRHPYYVVRDNDGYKYKIYYHNVMKNHPPQKFSSYNPFTIYNINLNLRYNKSNLICISKEYINNTTSLILKCKFCGTTFEKKLQNIVDNKEIKAYCYNCIKLNESIHANILKQIFKHEIENVIVEDKSCINYKTNHILPTDIVDYDNKRIIEIQSHYHDYDDVMERDLIKKKYWINRGFKYYAIDIRDYSIIEMINLFFNYDFIPEYVKINMNGNVNINIKNIQDLLDNKYSLKEISKILNIKIDTLRKLSKKKLIRLPNQYFYYTRNTIKPFVRLDKHGNYLSTHYDMSELSNIIPNFKSANIKRCLDNKNFRTAYGFIWIYKDKYDVGDYQIKTDKFEMPIIHIDDNGNHIKIYNTIYEASDDLGISSSSIYRVISGERKSVHEMRFIKFDN